MKHICVLTGLLVCQLIAQTGDPWADSVAVFEPGTGQTSGQDPLYFPENILGPPDSAASDSVPSTAPSEILSIGTGGRIVLAFNDNIIIDRPGVDFTVFENAFIRQFGPAAGLPFAEPARVAVSRDGVNFTAFPFDSLTLRGLAGVTPTNGRASPLEPEHSGGDSFDLAGIGVDSIRYVELTDVSELISANPDHPYWDPTLSGFDLDAVVAVNQHVTTVTTNEALAALPPSQYSDLRIFPNPLWHQKGQRLHINWRQHRRGDAAVMLFNLLGQAVQEHSSQSEPGRVSFEIDVGDLVSGHYLLLLTVGQQSESIHFNIIR